MTVIKLMKKGPLTAAQKKNMAKISDFVVHPKGSAVFMPKSLGIKEVHVDKFGSLKTSAAKQHLRQHPPGWMKMPKFGGISRGGPRRGGYIRAAPGGPRIGIAKRSNKYSWRQYAAGMVPRR